MLVIHYMEERHMRMLAYFQRKGKDDPHDKGW